MPGVCMPNVAGPVSRRAVQRTALIFGIWTLVAFITTQQQYVTLAYAGEPVAWRRLFVGSLASMWLWAAFTPPMIWLARRFRVDRSNWVRLVPLHFLFGVGLSVVDALVDRAWGPLVSAFPTRDFPFAVAVVRGLFINLICYVTIVALTYAVDYAALSREREVAAVRLKAQLADAHLHALQSQLRPHFLFNTLNTIAEQLYTDPAGADRLITKLGALLRASFTSPGEHELTLREEMEFLHNYLEIVRVRFRGRLTTHVDVAPDALDARVPNLILQPLVENALRHGIEPLEVGGGVEVFGRRRADRLELEVRDTGRGLRGDLLREGVGLRNTRERLEQLYGGEHEFSIRNRAGGGVVAAISLPYRSGRRGEVEREAEPVAATRWTA